MTVNVNITREVIYGRPRWTVFFAHNQNTTAIGIDSFPICLAVRGNSSPISQFIQLVNNRTGLVVGRSYEEQSLTSVTWDMSQFTYINISLSGKYVCQSETGYSNASYHIHVVGKS